MEKNNIKKRPIWSLFTSWKWWERNENFSIPKGISPNDIDLDKAKFLSGLPKILGKYPENNEDITLNNGRSLR